jgi:predicted nucleotidyltransferase component of viral defense system
MLDRSKHEIVLKRILADICQNKNLSASLGFKGGTCLYFFYDLDRFSTDLDFNLIGAEFNKNAITEILSRYLEIDQAVSKKNTLFWMGSFKKGSQKIKLEISKRFFPPDKYVSNEH